MTPGIYSIYPWYILLNIQLLWWNMHCIFYNHFCTTIILLILTSDMLWWVQSPLKLNFFPPGQWLLWRWRSSQKHCKPRDRSRDPRILGWSYKLLDLNWCFFRLWDGKKHHKKLHNFIFHELLGTLRLFLKRREHPKRATTWPEVVSASWTWNQAFIESHPHAGWIHFICWLYVTACYCMLA